jgi:hypothetical protein
MAILSARGSAFDIAATFGTTVTVTAATNAASSVVSVGAGHGAVVGDFFEILTAGSWQNAEGQVFRISNVATNDLTFEGFDTTNTSLFPAAGFVGATVRRIATWATISQVVTIETAGGEQQFTDITSITDQIGKQFPTIRSPVQVNLPVFYDPALTWVATVRAAARPSSIRALRVRGPSGARVLFNGFVSWVDAPKIEGDIWRNVVGFACVNVPVVYAS